MHDLVLEREHLVDKRRVLLRHGIDGLDACHEVVEAASAEDDGERGLLVLRRVDRDEPLRERSLPPAEIAAGHAERLMVDPKLPLELPQLLARRLVAAVRPLRGGVELLQLREHALRLRPLRADRVGVRARDRGPEDARKKQADQKCRERN